MNDADMDKEYARQALSYAEHMEQNATRRGPVKTAAAIGAAALAGVLMFSTYAFDLSGWQMLLFLGGWIALCFFIFVVTQQRAVRTSYRQDPFANRRKLGWKFYLVYAGMFLPIFMGPLGSGNMAAAAVLAVLTFAYLLWLLLCNPLEEDGTEGRP